MFGESVSSSLSIWASVNSWFTPTVLFVVLNLMIGTIAIASNFTPHKPTNHSRPSNGDGGAGDLPRSPSVLQRLKSINPYSYRSEESSTTEIETHYFEQPQLTRSPSLLQRLKSFNFSPDKPVGQSQPSKLSENQIHNEEPGRDEELTLDEVFSKLRGNGDGDHFNRTKSDTKPTGGEFVTKLPSKMKKSASSKSAFSHFEEEEIVEKRRPMTVREGREKMTTEIDDDEVDAKADDFINRFKQQLKLQRLDSIMKYKEMVGKGAGK